MTTMNLTDINGNIIDVQDVIDADLTIVDIEDNNIVQFVKEGCGDSIQDIWNNILFSEMVDITTDETGSIIFDDHGFNSDGELKYINCDIREDYEIERTRNHNYWRKGTNYVELLGRNVWKWVKYTDTVTGSNETVAAFCTISGDMNSDRDWSDVTLGVRDRNIEEILPPAKSFYSASKERKNAAQYFLYFKTCQLIDKYKNSPKNLCSIWTKFWTKCYELSETERNAWLCPWHIAKIKKYLNSLGIGVCSSDSWVEKIEASKDDKASLRKLWKEFWKTYFNHKASGTLKTWLSSADINTIKALFNSYGVSASE